MTLLAHPGCLCNMLWGGSGLNHCVGVQACTSSKVAVLQALSFSIMAALRANQFM